MSWPKSRSWSTKTKPLSNYWAKERKGAHPGVSPFFTYMPILPPQFETTPVAVLLAEAEKGLLGFDQRLIQTLIDRRDETLAAMETMLASEHDDALLDLTEQYFDLYRYFRTPLAIPYFVELLRKREDSIPDPMMEAFADLGVAAVEPLLELVEASAEDDRPDLVFLLATLGAHDERIRALIESTVARDPYEGALCAGLYGDPALKPAVAACLENTKPGAEERKVLEECLAELDRERGPHEPVEFDILGLYPVQSMPLFDQILPEDVVTFFECDDPAYRAFAAASFTDDQYADDVRDLLFVLAETDTDSTVRGAAWRALGERMAEPPILAHLIRIITTKQDEPEEWAGALIGLSRASGEPQVHSAILAAYDGTETRAIALEAMWRSLDPHFTKYFGPNLRHEDIYIRRQAIQGVGAIPIPALAFDLIPLLTDEEVRDDALFAYALAIQHNTTPKSVTKLYDMIVEKAGGLSEAEEDLLAVALDRRLVRDGYEPVFFPDDDHVHEGDEAETPVQSVSEKIGRNDPCPCGSGKKYKKCCGLTAA